MSPSELTDASLPTLNPFGNKAFISPLPLPVFSKCNVASPVSELGRWTPLLPAEDLFIQT